MVANRVLAGVRGPLRTCPRERRSLRWPCPPQPPVCGQTCAWGLGSHQCRGALVNTGSAPGPVTTSTGERACLSRRAALAPVHLGPPMSWPATDRLCSSSAARPASQRYGGDWVAIPVLFLATYTICGTSPWLAVVFVPARGRRVTRGVSTDHLEAFSPASSLPPHRISARRSGILPCHFRPGQLLPSVPPRSPGVHLEGRRAPMPTDRPWPPPRSR